MKKLNRWRVRIDAINHASLNHVGGTRFLQILKVLNEQWDRFPSLKKLSIELNHHPVTISRCFSKHAGITITVYSQLIKIDRATDMLSDDSRPLANIAYTCGFSDQSHMNRLFKKYVGLLPGEIRSQIKSPIKAPYVKSWPEIHHQVPTKIHNY